MTAINTLTHYDLVGRFPFEPLSSAYAGALPIPIEWTMDRRSGAKRIVIQWRDLNVQRYEIPDAPNGFWLAHTLDQLATAQGVPEVSDVDSIRGIWPQDDLSDGFDVALRQWRSQDAEHHQ